MEPNQLIQLTPAVAQGGGMALLGTALTLGLRHGIDWDHIAAITDITSAASVERVRRIHQRAVGLASLYAAGHGLVVVLLGLAALSFQAILPEWVDPIMERLVGVTLLALGAWVVYSLVGYSRGGAFRLQSRWMLLFAGMRQAWLALQRRLHGHSHDGTFHVHRVDQYGATAAFGVGVIHGIGAETGTQVLIIAAVGGAASQGLGLWMLGAFVAGLLLSNTIVALLTSTGFVGAGHARALHLLAGGAAAVFSLVVGSYAALGQSDALPELAALLLREPPVAP
jgi:high-affinity nickel-transport protein